jgi:hypothetical protein
VTAAAAANHWARTAAESATVFYRLPRSSGEACVAATATGAIAFDCTAPHRVVRPFRGPVGLLRFLLVRSHETVA